MIGKNIFMLNNSPLKVALNLKLFFLFLRELHLIYSKLKRRRITLNFMLEEFLLWMIVMNLFLNGLVLLKVLLILKIFLLIFQENSFNIIKFLRLLRKTLLKNVLKWFQKLMKMLKIIRNSMNNSQRILNLVSMKIQLIELNFLNSLDIIQAKVVKNKLLLKNMLEEWKKDKMIFSSLLVKVKHLLLNHHLLKH